MNVGTCMITGLPGSGKSLLAIELILKNANSDKPRPLYTNIKGCDYNALKCFPIENQDVPDIRPDNYPTGSIFVIDEAQEIFPPKPAGSSKTPIISLFETRRHYGYDFVIVTQHPMLVHKNLRLLISNHYHNVRPFGLGYRKVLQWSSVNEDPEPNHSQSDAVVTKKKHDKELFKYYKSSTMHVKQKNLPKKPFIVLAICLVVIIGSMSYVFASLSGPELEESPVTPPPSLNQSSGGFSIPNPITNDNDKEEEEPLFDGFTSAILINDNGRIRTEITFRYKGEQYYLHDWPYQISDRTVRVTVNNTRYQFYLPRFVDMETIVS